MPTDFWTWFNERLSEEGLPQRFFVKDGAYYYPVPRDVYEAEIFLRILEEMPSFDTSYTTFS